jgi:hypothetical protein
VDHRVGIFKCRVTPRISAAVAMMFVKQETLSVAGRESFQGNSFNSGLFSCCCKSDKARHVPELKQHRMHRPLPYPCSMKKERSGIPAGSLQPTQENREVSYPDTALSQHNRHCAYAHYSAGFMPTSPFAQSSVLAAYLAFAGTETRFAGEKGDHPAHSSTGKCNVSQKSVLVTIYPWFLTALLAAICGTKTNSTKTSLLPT